LTNESEAHEISTLLAAAFGGIHGSVTPPIVQSSLFTFDSYQAFEDRMAGRTNTAIYTRVQNPTVAAFEALMATAERGEAAIGCCQHECEPVSEWPMAVRVMPYRVGATQRERRSG